jgi:Ni,Fe-hydrogenase I cytochrome b subunit
MRHEKISAGLLLYLQNYQEEFWEGLACKSVRAACGRHIDLRIFSDSLELALVVE